MRIDKPIITTSAHIDGTLSATTIVKIGGLVSEYLMADGSVTSGTTGALSGSSDVTISSTPSDNQVLSWDTATSKWIPQTVAGSGNVTKVGTPLNSQIGVWTGDGTIEGTTDFKFDGDGAISTLYVGVDGTKSGFITLGGDSGNAGGQVNFRNGATNDTDDEFYYISTFTGGILQMGGSNTGRAFAYTSSSQNFNIEANTVQLGVYGSGTVTGTATYSLAVDSTGKIIEEALGGGSGTVTNVTVGTGLDVATSTTTPAITLNLNELSASGTLVGTDDIVVVDGTLTRKTQISTIPLSIFSNNLGWTSNAGTVTSVAGGTALTSTGGATPSLSLDNTAVTPGSYTLSDITVDAQGRITAASNGSGGGGMTSFNIQANGGTQVAITDSEEINFINGNVTTAVVVNQLNPTVTYNLNNTAVTPGSYTATNITVDAQGRITAASNGASGGSGTVTSVTVGTGLDVTNGTTTPNITLDLTELALGGTLVGTDHLIAENGGTDSRQVISSIPLSIFSNNLGWTSNAGDITNVGVTAPITGGGASGSVTVGITQATTSTNGYLSSTDWNTFNNKTSNIGDITSVAITAGNGLSGGGSDTTGSVSFTLDLGALTSNWNAGSTYTITANDFVLGSDKRLKTNIIPLEVKDVEIEFKQYEYKTNIGEKRFGVIAQELEVKNPELVRTDEDGIKSVSYIDLLIKKMAYLEQELNKLKNK